MGIILACLGVYFAWHLIVGAIATFWDVLVWTVVSLIGILRYSLRFSRMRYTAFLDHRRTQSIREHEQHVQRAFKQIMERK